MLKLDKVTFLSTPAIPGIRAGDLSTVTCDNPAGALVGWRIVLQGKAMFLVSPPGWTVQTATSPHARKKDGPVLIHEIPRDNVFLHWTADDDGMKCVMSGKSHETPPLGPKPEPVVLEMIPPPA